MSFEKFKELEKAKNEYFSNKTSKQNEIFDEIKEKLSLEKNYLIKPVPLNYQTFDRHMIDFGIKGDKSYKGSKSTHNMGFGDRIPLDDDSKYRKRLEKIGNNTGKEVNPDADISPSPQTYCLISQWVSKKKGKEEESKKDKAYNYFKPVSKGIVKSIYYA